MKSNENKKSWLRAKCKADYYKKAFEELYAACLSNATINTPKFAMRINERLTDSLKRLNNCKTDTDIQKLH